MKGIKYSINIQSANIYLRHKVFYDTIYNNSHHCPLDRFYNSITVYGDKDNLETGISCVDIYDNRYSHDKYMPRKNLRIMFGTEHVRFAIYNVSESDDTTDTTNISATISLEPYAPSEDDIVIEDDIEACKKIIDDIFEDTILDLQQSRLFVDGNIVIEKSGDTEITISCSKREFAHPLFFII